MSSSPRPYTLIAELTYACPLRCGYCSNPIEATRRGPLLRTEDWLRVFAEAEQLGVVMLNLTGGEPLLRRDLEALVRGARELDLYTHLITSGVPLTYERLQRLRDAGLEALQLSFQAAERGQNDALAGMPCFDQKLAVADWTKRLGLSLTINVVLHRQNIDQCAAVIALAERLNADRVELAHAQYLGSALINREQLLPSAAQLASARATILDARERIRGRMEVSSALPDYHASRPRACMEGWAQHYLVVNPTGLALPCHAAHSIRTLEFPHVNDLTLAAIWQKSPAFQAFRGEHWMSETCRECEHRSVDFGGCRCQAFQLTGDASATDPACRRTPSHALVEAALQAAETPVSPLHAVSRLLRRRV